MSRDGGDKLSDDLNPNINGASDWFNHVSKNIGLQDTNSYTWINLTVLYIVLIIVAIISVLRVLYLTYNTSPNYYYVGDFFINFFDMLKWLITSPFIILYTICSNQFTKIMNEPDYRSCFIKYSALYGFITAICIILYYASTSPTVLSSNAYVYSLLIIIPLIALFAYVVPFSSDKGNGTYFGLGNITSLFLIGLVIAFIGSIIYFYTKASSPTVVFLSYILNIILFLGSIAALAIFFYLFSNYLKSSTGIIGILIYFIFYIPCLLIDFTKYIINEFKMTTSIVFILFI
jgi:hypothetical protein